MAVRKRLVPRKRVVDTAAAQHRGDDLDVSSLLRLAGQRVVVEHDQVDVVA
jgi:hypothetical protein